MRDLAGFLWGLFFASIVFLVWEHLQKFGARFDFARHLYKNLLDRRKRRAVSKQLADALSMISGSLKSGFGLEQSVEFASREMPDPIGKEFARILADVRLGLSIEESFRAADDRLKLKDFSIVVQSIESLLETGGNLAEVFDSITNVVRERMEVEGRIRSFTYQGMFQAYTIASVPFVLGFLLWVIDEDYLRPLISEPLGITILSLACVLQAAGILWMRRVVRVRV